MEEPETDIWGPWNLGRHSVFAISCGDSPFRVESVDDLYSVVQASLAQNSFADYSAMRRLACTRWPFKASEILDANKILDVKTSKPTLFTNIRYDPVTPLVGAYTSASRFRGSGFLLHDGVGVLAGANHRLYCTRLVILLLNSAIATKSTLKAGKMHHRVASKRATVGGGWGWGTMRLINTSSGQLQEFFGSSIPSYAILSHTWGDDEVLYADIRNGSAASKKGYGKVSDFCQMVKHVGNLDWAWVDTCCINKESSAELSEAINSMYKWYKQSAVCYVYLQDVLVTGEQINQHVPPIWTTAYPANRLITANFPQSLWFTRGWTLQELIAPPYVEFYAADWTEIGTKRSLAPYISDITGIPIPILHGQSPQSCNVAERLSWASKRNTTREEDMAYCLLGLFNVNMPLLYGEGARSFIRLQEQILQQEEDYSIFTWTLEAHLGECLWGVLASSPLQFATSSRLAIHPPSFLNEFNDDWARKSIAYKALESMPPDSTEVGQDEVSLLPYQPVRLRDYKRLSQQAFHHSVSSFELIPSEPPQITSRGLRLTLPVKREDDASLPALAWIYCELDDRLLCLALHPSSGESSAQEARYHSSWLVGVDKSILREFRLEKIFCHPVGQVGVDSQGLESSVVSHPSDPPARLRIVLQSTAIEVTDCWPPKLLGKDEIFLFNSENRVGILDCKCILNDHSSDFYVCFGILEGKPWCTIISESKHEPEVKRDSVIGIGAKYSMEYISKLSAFSDRTSMLSSQIPNMVFTTSIRKDVLVVGPHAGFVLEIGLLDWLQRSLWADLSLSQAVLLPALPQQSVTHAASPKSRATKIQSPRKRSMMVEWHRILKTPGNGQEAVNIFEQIRQQARSQLERQGG